MTLPVPTEAQEATVLVAYLRTRGLKFTHIGNETGHDPYSKRRAIRMKQQGTSKGFPDYMVLLPQDKTATLDGLVLFIELKRRKKSLSRVTPEQREWIDALNSVSPSVSAVIAYGADAAIEQIEAYMRKPRMATQS